MNVWSCGELADRFLERISRKIYRVCVLRGIDMRNIYIASRFVGILSSELGRRHFCTDCRSDKLQDRRPERILIAWVARAWNVVEKIIYLLSLTLGQFIRECIVAWFSLWDNQSLYNQFSRIDVAKNVYKSYYLAYNFWNNRTYVEMYKLLKQIIPVTPSWIALLENKSINTKENYTNTISIFTKKKIKERKIFNCILI